jgi:DNA-binding PadR family transcriptional regulator
MHRVVLGPMGSDWLAGWFGGWWGAFDPDDRATGPRRGFFRSGEVRLALQSLLADGSAHGYDLMKRLEGRSGRTYHASAGTVYPVLQQLEDEGLISAQTVNGKKVYSLTAAGRQELSHNQDQIDAIWQRAERWHEMGSHLTPDTLALAVAAGQLGKAALRAAKAHPDLVERLRAIVARAIEDVRAAASGPASDEESGS